MPQGPNPLHEERDLPTSTFPEPDLLALAPPLLLDAIFLRANTSSNLRVVLPLLSS